MTTWSSVGLAASEAVPPPPASFAFYSLKLLVSITSLLLLNHDHPWCLYHSGSENTLSQGCFTCPRGPDLPTLLAFWLSASPWSSPYALSASLSTPEHSQHQHQGEILDHLESLLWNTVQPVVERPRSSAAAGTLPPWASSVPCQSWVSVAI